VTFAYGQADIGQGFAPADVGVQSEAQIDAEPTTADVNAILNANSNINSAFTKNDPSPLYFGIGQLGGFYPPSGSVLETETSSIDMTVDLTKAGTLHDLIIGFYSGTALGNIASDKSFSMTLDVNINGTDHKNTFTTVAGPTPSFRTKRSITARSAARRCSSTSRCRSPNRARPAPAAATTSAC